MERDLDIRVAAASDIPGEASGLMKSSSVTAAKELRPLDTVLIGQRLLIFF